VTPSGGRVGRGVARSRRGAPQSARYLQRDTGHGFSLVPLPTKQPKKGVRGRWALNLWRAFVGWAFGAFNLWGVQPLGRSTLGGGRLGRSTFGGYLFSSWFLGFLVFWFLGFLVSWFLGFLVSWFFGFLVSWFLGFLVAWFLGCLVSWFFGCEKTDKQKPPCWGLCSAGVLPWGVVDPAHLGCSLGCGGLGAPLCGR